jgi:hypothetical protein
MVDGVHDHAELNGHYFFLISALGARYEIKGVRLEYTPLTFCPVLFILSIL